MLTYRLVCFATTLLIASSLLGTLVFCVPGEKSAEAFPRAINSGSSTQDTAACLDSGLTPVGVTCCSDGEGGTTYGICCSPAANGGPVDQCTDFGALHATGAAWPSGWLRAAVVMAGPLAIGAANLGCATPSNAYLCDGGACLVATPYDGGGCPSSWDASAVVPNGYGATVFRATGVSPSFTVTYTANYPSGAGTCTGGGNCLDVPILTEYQTYGAGTGYFDGGGVNSLATGMVDTWNACVSGMSPYAGSGVCAPPPFWVEDDLHENYEARFNHALFHGSTQTQHDLNALSVFTPSYGTMQKYWQVITAGTSLVDHLPNGAADTIASADVPTSAMRLFTQLEIRTAQGYAATKTAVVGAVEVCGVGDGGPCF